MPHLALENQKMRAPEVNLKQTQMHNDVTAERQLVMDYI